MIYTQGYVTLIHITREDELISTYAFRPINTLGILGVQYLRGELKKGVYVEVNIREMISLSFFAEVNLHSHKGISEGEYKVNYKGCIS